MYDGINSDASTIAQKFPNAAMVAGYINGNFAWTQAEWNLFPRANHVTISVTASADAGAGLDAAAGDATPAQTAGWIARRKASGYYRPSIYCSRSVIPAVRQGTGSYILGRDYDIWAAYWTGSPHQGAPPAATRYETPTTSAGPPLRAPAWPPRPAPGRTPPAEPANVHTISVTATS